MDLRTRRMLVRLAAGAALAGLVFVAIGLYRDYAFVWLSLGVGWLTVAVLAVAMGVRWR